VTTTSEPNAAVIVADTGNRRVSLFRVKSDHYGEGIFDLNFFFGHQIFEAPTGIEYDPNRGLLVVADQVQSQPHQPTDVFRILVAGPGVRRTQSRHSGSRPAWLRGRAPDGYLVKTPV